MIQGEGGGRAFKIPSGSSHQLPTDLHVQDPVLPLSCSTSILTCFNSVVDWLSKQNGQNAVVGTPKSFASLAIFILAAQLPNRVCFDDGRLPRKERSRTRVRPPNHRSREDDRSPFQFSKLRIPSCTTESRSRRALRVDFWKKRDRSSQ